MCQRIFDYRKKVTLINRLFLPVDSCHAFGVGPASRPDCSMGPSFCETGLDAVGLAGFSGGIALPQVAVIKQVNVIST